MNERPRVTLAASSELLSGVGLHSGADASVRLHPAPVGTGLVFRAKGSGQEIPARAANVSDTSRCTRLSAGGFEVQTVEHVLSALAGLGVDDAVIELSSRESKRVEVLESKQVEVPAADGSAAPFVLLIRAAGLRELSETVMPLTLTSPLFLSEGSSTVIALPSDHFSATVVLDYPRQAYLGTIAAAYSSASGDYDLEIAPARTFGFLSEIEHLRALGLGLGASYDNAVVLGAEGYETPVRFPNELARHKLLDLIGDLALVGRPLQAQVIAVKPGHTINTRLARVLSEHPS